MHFVTEDSFVENSIEIQSNAQQQKCDLQIQSSELKKKIQFPT